jgi:hypothetical protein
LASRIYELVRSPAVRNEFRTQTYAYLAESLPHHDCALPIPVESEWVEDEEVHAKQRTLAEKYAYLAAHHDNTYPHDGPIMPQGNSACATEPEIRELCSWCALKTRVQDDLPRCPNFRAEGWFNDALADLQRQGLVRTRGEAAPVHVIEQYVTLDQAAALVNRSKKTLERAINKQGSEAPPPDVEGGGGRPHEWCWSKLRPWLENTYGKILPERLPTRVP